MDAVESNRGLWSRLRCAGAALSSSRWAPVLSKIGLGAGALVLLALVGGRVRASGPIPAEQLAAADLALAAAVIEPVASNVHAPSPSADEPSQKAPSCGSGAGTTADGKVILNMASAETLGTLPGVGPNRAKAIIELRDKLGKFRRIEDLLRIRGIGQRSLAKLRPLVVLDAEPPAT